jgi:hypothetical protein
VPPPYSDVTVNQEHGRPYGGCPRLLVIADCQSGGANTRGDGTGESEGGVGARGTGVGGDGTGDTKGGPGAGGGGIGGADRGGEWHCPSIGCAHSSEGGHRRHPTRW